VYEVTERSMVPDDSLSIRERAIAAWPPAWHGQNLRDILVSLGYDVDSPWRDLPCKDRDWILYTDEQPTVPVYAGYTPAETRRALRRKEEPSYMGTFTGARKYVLQTFSTTQSALMKKRVARFMTGALCPSCKGKRLKREALEVTFAGHDIGALSQLSLAELARALTPAAQGRFGVGDSPDAPQGLTEEKRIAAQRIARNVKERVETLQALGLGYLSTERSTPTLSPGELQRLRLATQIRSNLFGVIYVLDEPSAGLHPADTEALITALDQLKRAGNSLFVVEHDLDLMRHADWIVDVGPEAGSHGGRVLYSGTPPGLRGAEGSHTARYLFDHRTVRHEPRTPRGWLRLKDLRRNNLKSIDVDFPVGVFTAVTGVSGSGKSSLVSQSLVELVAAHLGHEPAAAEDEEIEVASLAPVGGRIDAWPAGIKRLVTIDQKPIGRTPRSNLATYTGLFDAVRTLFAAAPMAKARRYSAGRFSFNVPAGRCDTCEGEGFVCVELLFMPSVYAPCPTCHGARYNAKTLEVQYRGRNIAEVLGMTVEEAQRFFEESPALAHTLQLLREIGLGYLRLGQPATELSGGEAQRIKLITELQRQQRGATLYVIDEPTIGLHPADVDKLMTQLNALVDAGNTVIVAEHEMRVAAGADWLIDMGPGAGDLGGTVVARGTPAEVAAALRGRTAAYLAAWLEAEAAPEERAAV
jgi:excinuclease ABC subunit A